MHDKGRRPIRILPASILAGTYICFFLAFHLHPIFSQEHRHDRKICHAPLGEVHFHSEEYAVPDCSACVLVPVLQEPASFSIPLVILPQVPDSEPVFGRSEGLSTLLSPPIQPRAPPLG